MVEHIKHANLDNLFKALFNAIAEFERENNISLDSIGYNKDRATFEVRLSDYAIRYKPD
jgi:hypothetical protein